MYILNQFKNWPINGLAMANLGFKNVKVVEWFKPREGWYKINIVAIAIKKGEIHAWNLNKYITIAKHLLETFAKFEFWHAIRSRNDVVGRLSKWAMKLDDGPKSIIEYFRNLELNL